MLSVMTPTVKMVKVTPATGKLRFQTRTEFVEGTSRGMNIENMRSMRLSTFKPFFSFPQPEQASLTLSKSSSKNLMMRRNRSSSVGQVMHNTLPVTLTPFLTP